MSKRLWNIGMKCPDLVAEVEFNRQMGHKIVVERETVRVGDRDQQQAMVKVGDKYLVLFEGELGLEKTLSEKLDYGATHMSHMVDDIDAAMQTARNAGATLLHGPDRLDGEFGSRITACFRSPGGLVFCLFQVIEHKVEVV